MEAPAQSFPDSNESSSNGNTDQNDEIGQDEVDEYENGGEESDSSNAESGLRTDRDMLGSFFRRLSTEQVLVRVHDIIIQGNNKTKSSLIESLVDEILRNATSVQQLAGAARYATMQLENLDIFDSVTITLDAGPRELPGTANVFIVVSEKSPLSGDFGIYTKPEVKSWTLEAALKGKNLFGYGDIWDCLVGYGWGQSLELSTGVSVPRFKSISHPLSARISLLSQDWLKLSSYKEQVMGLSLGLFSSGNHDLSYNLNWCTLTDPSQMASPEVRRQLGHRLSSGLKYAFKIDHRDSPLRPTRGFAFASTTHICGLYPGVQSLRFVRQEVDLRYAIPLGLYRASLNLGISAGFIFPWGDGFLNKSSYIPERFFMDGNASPVCSLKGPTSIFGFKPRGLGPAEPRRVSRDDGNSDSSSVDHIGGDLALTCFADLSFDLPLKVLRNAGIHGHMFACAGNLSKLTDNAYKELSLQKFRATFRTTAGFGLIVPTRLFRMEANYCYIVRQQEHDCGKTGIQFSFSSYT